MIGYYVHHRGRGHLTRARNIARHLRDDVTALSSLPRPDDWRGGWVRLPRDDGASPVDPTANDALHWVPRGDQGLRDRMAAISRWIAATAPGVVAVDVSVEVALLARLHGVPTVVFGMQGEREDPAHALGYRIADTIVVPWPREVRQPSWVERFAAAVVHAGALSRFDGRSPPPARGNEVLVMGGAGGASFDVDAVRAAAAATPGWRWRCAGVPGGSTVDDVWSALCAARVVVTHAGQNAVAEVAAARRPAVIVPQPRPFGEQEATAMALAEAGLARTVPAWPRPDEWPGLLADACRIDPCGWARWAPGDGARRAAAVLDAYTAGADEEPVGCAVA